MGFLLFGAASRSSFSFSFSSSRSSDTHHISDISDTQYSPMPHLGHTILITHATSRTQYSSMPHLGHTSHLGHLGHTGRARSVNATLRKTLNATKRTLQRARSDAARSLGVRAPPDSPEDSNATKRTPKGSVGCRARSWGARPAGLSGRL